MKMCSVETCDRASRARGLCDAHYRRVHRGQLPAEIPIRRVTQGMTVAERLVFYTDRRGKHDCWPWRCGRDKDGYGAISVNGHHRRAHVIAWELASGQVCPKGMCVMHSCDNPPCVNPAHLRLGTNGENVADMVAKGRAFRQRGSKHGNSKLTEEQVKWIRRLYKRGSTTREIAEIFSVTQSNIWYIVLRKTWTHC
jgi:hypothetical protein